jgi:FkbM family methyltransferase
LLVLNFKGIVRAAIPRGARNWMRSPRKSVGWAWGEAEYLCGRRERIEIRPGWRLLCHPLAYRHSYFAQVADAEQAAEFDSFIAHCTPGMVLFDVGAHFGLFSLAALHYGGAESQAIAVDASPTAARMLEVQARLNGAQDRLRVVRACVCDEVGTRGMVAIGPLADGYFTPPTRETFRSDVTTTPALTLDRLAELTGVRPTHIKLDIEGFEESALRGGRNLLRAANAPVLFVELHNQLIQEQGGEPGGVLDLLREFNYVPQRFDGARAEHTALLAKPLVRFIATRA